MGDDLGGAISAMLGCDLSNVIAEVRLSERKEEKGDGFEGMWIGYEGGFERCVLLAAWERQIGDVGGEMGFAGVSMGFALVDRVHAKLEVGRCEVE